MNLSVSNIKNSLVPRIISNCVPSFLTPRVRLHADTVFFTESAYRSEKCLLKRLTKIAMQELKMPRIRTGYKKAVAQDFERLTSTKLEDSYKRAVWINPKDNKIYNFLYQGRTQEGKIKLRVLDNEGAYLREIEAKPAKVIILDDMTSKDILCGSLYLGHGECVEALAKRTNPFCDYEVLNTHSGNNPMGGLVKRLESIKNRMAKGEKIDFVSISAAYENETLKHQKIPNTVEEIKQKQLSEIREYISLQKDFIPSLKALQINKELYSRGCRVIMGAGNNGKPSVNVHLIDTGVIGAGALSPNGAKRESSASRLFTDLYARGKYEVILTKEGINISALNGADLKPPKHMPKLNGEEIYMGDIAGTSFATPVCAANLAFVKMLSGIL